MNKGEREDLARAVRLRAKAAKALIAQRKAEMEADVERQLSAIHKEDNELWADITRRAGDAVRDLDAKLGAVCREHGIREDFRPRLALDWYGRGVNASAQRRGELRKLAYKRIEALAAEALAASDSAAADLQIRLIAGGLESEEARAFLEALPTAEQLLPKLDVRTIGEQQRLIGPDALDDTTLGIPRYSRGLEG
jgi:hypothetical protein